MSQEGEEWKMERGIYGERKQTAVETKRDEITVESKE